MAIRFVLIIAMLGILLLPAPSRAAEPPPVSSPSPSPSPAARSAEIPAAPETSRGAVPPLAPGESATPPVATLPEMPSSASGAPLPVATHTATPQVAQPSAQIQPERPAGAAAEGLSFYGIFDMYYGVNFNRPAPAQSAPGPNGIVPLAPAQNGGTGGNLRSFDLYHNQIALNLFELGVKKTGKELTLRAELDFGEIAEQIATTNVGGVDGATRNIGQVTLAYTPAALSNLTVTAGKFYAPMGYETIKARDAFQYSHSYLFTLGLPFWHAGVTANYSWLPGKFSTLVGVYNGWNTLYDDNSGKTLGFQANWNPTPSISFFYNLETGPEQPNDNEDRKTVHEAIMSWTFSQKAALVLDLIAGTSSRGPLPGGALGDAGWRAAEVIGHYAFTPVYSLCPRLEVYSDPDGFTSGAPQVLREATLTNDFVLSDGLETRLELRYDQSSIPVFLASSGPRNEQVTAVAALLYSF